MPVLPKVSSSYVLGRHTRWRWPYMNNFFAMKPEAMECITQGRKDQKEIPSEIVEEKLKDVKTCGKNQINPPILLWGKSFWRPKNWGCYRSTPLKNESCPQDSGCSLNRYGTCFPVFLLERNEREAPDSNVTGACMVFITHPSMTSGSSQASSAVIWWTWATWDGLIAPVWELVELL